MGLEKSKNKRISRLLGKIIYDCNEDEKNAATLQGRIDKIEGEVDKLERIKVLNKEAEIDDEINKVEFL